MGGWVATKFSVKHQGKDIHHPPSISFSFFSLVDPMPFPFPELHNIEDILHYMNGLFNFLVNR